jgi:DNA polymerase-3 subunit epsilon
MLKEIVLDTETTGLDPISGHRIVEIGAVKILNKMKTGEVFHAYLNPERDMPDEAFKVHGISAAFLKDKRKFNEIADEFIEFIGDENLVIHNARFDIKFLNFELVKAGKAELSYARVIDTLDLARRKFPGSPASLNALCKRFGIDLSGREKHGALLDSELLAEVYLWLCGGVQPEMLETTEENEDYLSMENKLYNINRKSRSKRKFEIDPQDLNAHVEFMKKILTDAS